MWVRINGVDRSALTASLTAAMPEELEMRSSMHWLGEGWARTASRKSCASCGLRTERFPEIMSRNKPWSLAARRGSCVEDMVGFVGTEGGFSDNDGE
jgi:hypothetical protein